MVIFFKVFHVTILIGNYLSVKTGNHTFQYYPHVCYESPIGTLENNAQYKQFQMFP